MLAWNAVVLRALKQDASAPLLVARALAILHVAQWRTVEHEKQADEIAVAAAGYTVAITLLPGHRGEFEALWTKQLGKDSARRRAGIFKGEAAARAVLAERENDGSATHVSYVPRSEPGQWRRTPPFLRPPELPQWASQVKPFALESAVRFRLPGPPPLTDKKWAKAFNEIKSLGAKDSKTRTVEQTAIAQFWSDFSYTETPPGHWNSIARTLATQRKLPLAKCARLFATLNVALTDAGIACWEAKYRFNFWRPVTAIARVAEDGNDATDAAEWEPLLTTPAHPEYPSGHGAFSGAAAVVLAHFLGGDAVNFTVRSDALPGAERRFASLRACAEECGTSRVFGGIHYRFSCEDGMRLGAKVGGDVLERQNAVK